jgi:hypothetical protein
MLGIFVDIENEVSDIAREVEMLSRSLELYENPPQDAPEAWHWIMIQGFASGAEKVYSGCERVMEMIASEIDRAKVDHAGGWHMSLLKRMAHPYPGVREAVISTSCSALFGTGSATRTGSPLIVQSCLNARLRRKRRLRPSDLRSQPLLRRCAKLSQATSVGPRAEIAESDSSANLCM